MAVKYQLPVIPMAISWRPAGGFHKLVNKLKKKNLPMATLRIGDPILPDLSEGRREATRRLRRETHEAIIRLAGITNNPWPAEGD
jgi:1-acyl-sn-glycerol-3-phosphate acyltransferase